MRADKAISYGFLCVAVAAACTVVAWPGLPDDLAIHWNAYGRPNGWLPKGGGVAGTLFAMLLPPVVYRMALKEHPDHPELERARTVLCALVYLVCSVLLAAHLMVLAYGLGHAVDTTRVGVAVGAALFLGTGNFLGKVPLPPRRRASRAKAMRFGGRLLAAQGLLLAVGALNAWRLPQLLALTGAGLTATLLAVAGYGILLNRFSTDARGTK